MSSTSGAHRFAQPVERKLGVALYAGCTESPHISCAFNRPGEQGALPDPGVPANDHRIACPGAGSASANARSASCSFCLPSNWWRSRRSPTCVSSLPTVRPARGPRDLEPATKQLLCRLLKKWPTSTSLSSSRNAESACRPCRSSRSCRNAGVASSARVMSSADFLEVAPGIPLYSHPADPHSLVPVARSEQRKTFSTGRQLEGIAVPFEHLQIPRESPKNGIAPRRLCQEDVAEPELQRDPR